MISKRRFSYSPITQNQTLVISLSHKQFIQQIYQIQAPSTTTSSKNKTSASTFLAFNSKPIYIGTQDQTPMISRMSQTFLTPLNSISNRSTSNNQQPQNPKQERKNQNSLPFPATRFFLAFRRENFRRLHQKNLSILVKWLFKYTRFTSSRFFFSSLHWR